MLHLKCIVCNQTYGSQKRTSICPACKERIAGLPKELTYNERIKRLKEQLRKDEKHTKARQKATIQQEQALKRCSGCLWVRNIDRTRGKVSCSLPSCVRRWDKKYPI